VVKELMRREDKNVPRKMSGVCLRALEKEGFTQSQIARVCGISRQAVNQRASRELKDRARKRINYRKIAIGLLYPLGVPMRAIAEALEMTVCNVSYYVGELKLPRRQSRR